MASTPFRCEYSTNWRKKASRRRAHEPPEVVTADRIGGVQCGMVDQLPAHGVCRCADGSGWAGPVDREMKGERMWTKTKKKARLRRAQRAALMNGAQGKIFTVTYQDYQKPEVLRTDLNSLPAVCSPALKACTLNTDSSKPAAEPEHRGLTAEES